MEFWSAVTTIVLIDLVLSGDNALIIGMAARELPTRQRRQAIVAGGIAAAVLRLALTGVATLLLGIPGLRAVGGVLLLGIAFRLLKKRDQHGPERSAGNLREAVLTILAADAVMSLDNVLGVAGASHGNLALLLFGLGLSVAVLMVGGSLIASLVSRVWWLTYLGAAVIAWTGATLLLEDEALTRAVDVPPGAGMAIAALTAAIVVLMAHWVHVVRPVSRSSSTVRNV
ncbi:MAG: YjbE family putative metal transport protein [Chloroflexota bacterium]